MTKIEDNHIEYGFGLYDEWFFCDFLVERFRRYVHLKY